MALTRPLINNLNTNIEIFNDTITVLHANASIANSDIGLLMNRAGGLVPNAAFYWSESTLAFVAALTSNTGVGYSNITATSYANITTGSLNASSVTASGTVVATGFYYPNGQNVSAGSVNLSIYLNKVTATNTAYTLVDSLSNVGNTSVRWTVSSSDNIYSNFKMSTINAVTNGANVYYTEYGVLQNNNSANVATFTSNVYNGLISLWALGGSGNVTVAIERESLGTGITAGYLSSTGPQGAQGNIGPTGTVANTTSWIVTTNLTAATSTTTGALQVSGGAGIGANLWVGGTINGNAAAGSAYSNAVGYIGLPQNAQSSSYTLALTDQGEQIYLSSTANVTIPANATVAFPVGTTINIITGPTATANVLINSDTLYLGGIGTTGTRTLSTYAMATLVKVGTTSWYIGGTGVS